MKSARNSFDLFVFSSTLRHTASVQSGGAPSAGQHEKLHTDKKDAYRLIQVDANMQQMLSVSLKRCVFVTLKLLLHSCQTSL